MYTYTYKSITTLAHAHKYAHTSTHTLGYVHHNTRDIESYITLCRYVIDYKCVCVARCMCVFI